MRLTKTSVDRLKTPAAGQVFFRDDTLKGFAVRVTSTGAKSFIVEGKVNGKSRRKTLGKYPGLTVEQARKLARTRLGEIASGRDPEAEKREEEAAAITLAEVFGTYLQARSALKPKTVADYGAVMRTCFKDWQCRPLAEITKDMVERRHRKIAEDQGKATANLAMRVLRAMFNFAAAKYEDAKGRSILPENPVKRLSATRAWYRVERRTTLIKPHQLKPWFDAVMALESDRATGKAEVVRDYLLLMLLTGLRRQEAAKLTWANVDLDDRTLTVVDPKNRQDHELPLSDYLHDLLVRRKAEAGGDFVFPGAGKGGYIVEPRKQIDKVIAASGVPFTPHDLRRTFITIAESLDIPAYALKRLLNHKMNNDVTSGYIVTDVGRLRKPMQQVTDFILKAVGAKETAAVVELSVGPRRAIN